MTKEEFIQYWLLANCRHGLAFDVDKEISRAEKAWDAIIKACQSTTKYQVD